MAISLEGYYPYDNTIRKQVKWLGLLSKHIAKSILCKVLYRKVYVDFEEIRAVNYVYRLKF